jgi:hypothetical protein
VHHGDRHVSQVSLDHAYGKISLWREFAVLERLEGNAPVREVAPTDGEVAQARQVDASVVNVRKENGIFFRDIGRIDYCVFGPRALADHEWPMIWHDARVPPVPDSARYVEDCQVCCQPIEFNLEVDPSGVLQSLSTLRGD